MKAANDAGSLDAWQARRKKQLHKPRVSRSKREDRTEDGIVFGSKAELIRYRELKKEMNYGLVAWFVRNPGFDVLGCKVYADNLVVRETGLKDSEGRELYRIEVEDVKGRGGSQDHRRRFERNRKQVREMWGVEIQEVIR